MSASIASTFYTMGYANSIASDMEANRADVLVLTPEEFLSILQDRVKGNALFEANVRKELAQTSLGKYWNQTLYPNINQPATVPISEAVNDALRFAKAMIALGAVGTICYAKAHNGKTYLIFKGDAKLRNLLKGTRYLANNPRILQLGLGMQGVKQVAKGGFILGLVVDAGIEITDFILNDQKTMYDLVGGIGVEVVKGGVASLVAYGVGLGIATVTGVAVLPILGMLGIALAVGYGLNLLDDTFEIKKRVSAALSAVPKDLAAGIYTIHEGSIQMLRMLGNASVKDEATLRRLDVLMRQAIRRLAQRY